MPLKILWLVNVLFPAAAQEVGLEPMQGGGWLIALAEALGQNPDIQLGIAATVPGRERQLEFQKQGITYFVHIESQRLYQLRRLGVIGWRGVIHHHLSFLERFRPDVVVVHGTELGYGLIARETRIPVIISLQGLLRPYATAYWGELTNPLRRLLYPSSMKGWLMFLIGTRHESRILKSTRYFTGRTLWDYGQVLRENRDFDYFPEDRVLRPPFYGRRWDLSRVRRHAVFTATTAKFLKGTPTLIRAISLLRKEFPDIRLSIAGDVPARDAGGYIRRLIRKESLEDHVVMEGHLGAERLAEKLCESHAFCLPSYIENSPNSLAEAQSIGVPCVASAVGGVPDMLQHGINGLLFTAGDSYMLAGAIQRLFRDDALARTLSEGALATAGTRHAPDRIVDLHLAMCRYVKGAALVPSDGRHGGPNHS